MAVKKKVRFTLVRGENWIGCDLRFTHGTYHEVDDKDIQDVLRASTDARGRRRFAEGDSVNAKPAKKDEVKKPVLTEENLREGLTALEVVFPPDAEYDELRELYNKAVAEKGEPDSEAEVSL